MIDTTNHWTSLVIALATVAITVSLGSCQQQRHRPILPPDLNVPARKVHAPYDGIDISSHQAMIDWVAVSSDRYIEFVYIKATEGATYSSPHYGYNVEMARRKGILVGSYHYFTTTAPIRQQFENFTRLAAASTQDLIPMLDIEEKGDWTRKQLCDSVNSFAELIEEHYGVRPMIYSTMSFYNNNLAPQFNSYHLYIGRYSEQPPEIDWDGHYTIWQYSQTGVVPGIDAYVDLCHFAPDRWLDDIILGTNDNNTQKK